jgi:FlaA1/EpsC-like NDP-sugar epimerase
MCHNVLTCYKRCGCTYVWQLPELRRRSEIMANTSIPAETLPSLRHEPYPGIDISNYYGRYKGKVLFITGASKGLGKHTALAFAKTGASLFLVSTNRSKKDLQDLKKEIEVVYSVKVGTAVADVTKEDDVKNAVQGAVEKFGRIDFVVSNAGINSDWGNSKFD